MNEKQSNVIRAKNANSNFGTRGWSIVILGMVMYFCSAGIIVEGSNVMYPAIEAAQGLSVAGLYSMATVANLISIPLAFLFGLMIDKVGPRKIMALSWVLGAVGLVIVAFSYNFTIYCIGRCLISLASVGGITMAYNTLIANWFPTKKDLIQGYATIGSNLATAFSVIVLNILITKFAIRSTLFIAAVACLVIASISFLCYRDNPEEVGCYPDNDTSMTKEKAAELLNIGEEYKKTSPWTIKKLLKTKQVWQIAIGFGIILLCTVGILSTFVSTLAIKGLETNIAISMMTVAAVIAMPCSYLWGWLGAKFGTKNASLLLYGILALCILTMLIPASWSAYISCALLGCFIGAGNNLTPSIIASVFGRYDFPKAMTVIIPLWNIVVSFATTIVGVPQSLTGSYVAPYIVLLICAAIGFFLVLKLDETCIGRADLEQ